MNGKCYIGQSVNIERRFDEHKKYTNRTGKYLHNSMNKYGVDNFSFEIIEECKKSELSEREKYWISYYNSTSPNGYNLTNGGDGGNTFQYRTKEQMEDTKRKISEVTSGENNGFYGKHHSEETKEYLRKINLGKTISEETKNKISKAKIGHYVAEQTKEKISEATKKQWQDINFKTLMTNKAIGNEYAKGNEWNIGRVDIYNEETFEHRRILKDELSHYINNGYILGLPPNDKRYNPKIKHCTIDNLVGVWFDKKYNKWRAYINYKNKRYGSKSFQSKENAITYRNILENIFKQINENNTLVSQVNIEQSLQQGKVVLYCE